MFLSNWRVLLTDRVWSRNSSKGHRRCLGKKVHWGENGRCGAAQFWPAAVVVLTRVVLVAVRDVQTSHDSSKRTLPWGLLFVLVLPGKKQYHINYNGTRPNKKKRRDQKEVFTEAGLTGVGFPCGCCFF